MKCSNHFYRDRLFLFLCLIMHFSTVDGREIHFSWSHQSLTQKQSIQMLVNLLQQSSQGSQLWSQAEEVAAKNHQSLYDLIQLGTTSATDTSIVRRYQVHQPLEVEYESRRKVTLNKYLALEEAVIDLAHELTHFVYRKDFNPYQDSFNLALLVRQTIEGPGGEIEAYLNECQVVSELFTEQVQQRFHCHRIYDQQSKKFSFSLAKKEFYKLGPFFNEFKKVFEKKDFLQFSEATSEQGLLISSASGIPYPLASVRDLYDIQKRSCIYDQQRLDRVEKILVSDTQLQFAWKKLSEDYQERCL
jgi:hypothetical protein